MTPLNSDNGKKLFRTAVDKVVHQQFASLDSLPKEVSDLDAEFYLWKSVLPSATVVALFLVVFFSRFQKKNDTKFLQLAEQGLEFKVKIKAIQKTIENLKNGSNRNHTIPS